MKPLYSKPKAKELTSQERAFIVAFHLADGGQLNNRQIAEMTGLTPRSVYRLMDKGSRVVPIYSRNGMWKRT